MISNLRKENAISRLTMLVMIPVCTFLLFMSFQVIPIFYYHFEFQSQMKALIDVAETKSQSEWRERLRLHCRKMSMPFTGDDVLIRRESGDLVMEISYREPVYLSLGSKEVHITTFDLHAIARGPYSPKYN